MAKWVVLEGGAGYVEARLRQNDAHTECLDQAALSHRVGAVEEHSLAGLAVEAHIVGDVELILEELLDQRVAEPFYSNKGFVGFVWLDQGGTVIVFFGNMDFAGQEIERGGELHNMLQIAVERHKIADKVLVDVLERLHHLVFGVHNILAQRLDILVVYGDVAPGGIFIVDALGVEDHGLRLLVILGIIRKGHQRAVGLLRIIAGFLQRKQRIFEDGAPALCGDEREPRFFGAVNLYVAYNFSMDTWVSFKLWSALLFTVLWAVMIGIIMGPYLKEDSKEDLREAGSAEENETTKTF